MFDSIGVDIEEIDRFTRKKFFDNKSFYEQIFTNNEIKYCLSKIDPYPHFAVRFCAKEAAIKALSDKKILLKNIEVILKEDKPILKIFNEIIGLVSLSHSKNHAIAFVMIQKNLNI